MKSSGESEVGERDFTSSFHKTPGYKQLPISIHPRSSRPTTELGVVLIFELRAVQGAVLICDVSAEVLRTNSFTIVRVYHNERERLRRFGPITWLARAVIVKVASANG
jgi:hypothetical protein